MNNHQPTATPWSLEGESGRDYEGDVIIADGKHIAVIITEDAVTVTGEDRANAEHIVRCVNMHNPLREVLDYLLRETVDMDLKHGITLSEGEADARKQALDIMAMTATDNQPLAA